MATPPAFREVFTCKLTSPTTCYSVPRQVSHRNNEEEEEDNSNTPWTTWARLATERHVMEVQMDNRHQDNQVFVQQNPVLTPSGIPKKIAKNLRCAGYDSCGDWEVFVLLDASRVSEQEEEELQPHTTTTQQGDDGTIVTMDGAGSTAAASNTNNNRPRRRVSSSNNSVSSTDTGTTAMTVGSTTSAASSATPAVINIDTTASSSISTTTASSANVTTGNNIATNNAATTGKLANLVEEKDEEKDNDQEEEEQNKQPLARIVLQHCQTKRQFSKGIEYRPLAPKIVILQQPRQESETAVVGVWVGSADDTKLRLFRTPTHDCTSLGAESSSSSLSSLLVETNIMGCPVDDEEENTTTTNTKALSPISFQSPIMAIDCVSLSPHEQEQPSTPRAGNLPTLERTEDDFASDDDGEEEQGLVLERPKDHKDTSITDTDTRGLVGVACQDGTIRFYGYSWSAIDNSNTLQCREECTVVVDGPIVSLHLHVHAADSPHQAQEQSQDNNNNKDNAVEAIVGSLCGYAARFYKPSMDVFSWQGPFMVAEGFGTAMNDPSAADEQDEEDSILAVHAWEDKVALGTYSGRCLLFGRDAATENNSKTAHDDDYGMPYWDCQLPDPIHGICPLPTTLATTSGSNEAGGAMRLLVTTRRSLHIFQEVPREYDPERAKRKLEMLLSHQRQHDRKNVVGGAANTTPRPETTTTTTADEDTKEQREADASMADDDINSAKESDVSPTKAHTRSGASSTEETSTKVEVE
ncbi:expressed unknown protein [Seminavis robusta]|uniref:Uncharacterized protein n=1 Tax=Seminavis robusta TaxID=568900 RepID=A0A9N8HJG3_9STRA|nr:expressed unknown protein [Seminavis robusta]|eukprot:Sro691_g187810.1 n/a (753) ;mRNA; r:16022-18280